MLTNILKLSKKKIFLVLNIDQMALDTTPPPHTLYQYHYHILDILDHFLCNRTEINTIFVLTLARLELCCCGTVQTFGLLLSY